MTTCQAAKKWGTNTNLVCKWIKRKAIPATKVCNAQGRMVWDIPDDTPCPQRKIAILPSETAEMRVLRNKGKHGYVARFSYLFSIRHMAQFLQTTPAEIRAIYDDIVAGGGM